MGTECDQQISQLESSLETYFGSLSYCNASENMDSSFCIDVSNSNTQLLYILNNCSTELQTQISTLNEEVITLNIQNADLKAQLKNNSNKSNLSVQLFDSYKQIYAIDYLRNILMILAIFILLGKIGFILSNIK